MPTENELYEQDFGKDFPELRNVGEDAWDDVDPIAEANERDIELEHEED